MTTKPPGQRYASTKTSWIEKGGCSVSAPIGWTHYAAKHRGICLGFDLKKTLAKEVTYEQARLARKIDHFTAIDDKLADLLLCTKFASWEYEQEWRVPVTLANMAREDQLYFYEFSNDDLRLVEVILGSLCSLRVEAVRALTNAHHPGAVTFQARLASHSFNIVPREKTVPHIPSLR